ncbi:uncharacterized protein A4U43_C02F13420 [Asparagus officinalis]|uniref:Uncharacterized protein n=1 Tax=Asparagus officinalis TaxID=4686 RepID=A0A5P1FI85_ASPOF|nr:uncharacterized protein A4U43_C02F13420 [Asparagus officinalis]
MSKGNRAEQPQERQAVRGGRAPAGEYEGVTEGTLVPRRREEEKREERLDGPHPCRRGKGDQLSEGEGGETSQNEPPCQRGQGKGPAGKRGDEGWKVTCGRLEEQIRGSCEGGDRGGSSAEREQRRVDKDSRGERQGPKADRGKGGGAQADGGKRRRPPAEPGKG